MSVRRSTCKHPQIPALLASALSTWFGSNHTPPAAGTAATPEAKRGLYPICPSGRPSTVARASQRRPPSARFRAATVSERLPGPCTNHQSAPWPKSVPRASASGAMPGTCTVVQAQRARRSVPPILPHFPTPSLRRPLPHLPFGPPLHTRAGVTAQATFRPIPSRDRQRAVARPMHEPPDTALAQVSTARVSKRFNAGHMHGRPSTTRSSLRPSDTSPLRHWAWPLPRLPCGPPLHTRASVTASRAQNRSAPAELPRW